MRVLVCGGRNFRDKVKVWGWLQAIHLKRGIECIIHGDATGADTLAGRWAEAEKVPVEPYPTDWNAYERRRDRFGTGACSPRAIPIWS